MLGFIKASGAKHAIMAGQIAPRNLFDLRPDIKALVLLAKLKSVNAESIFAAIGAEMASAGVELLPRQLSLMTPWPARIDRRSTLSRARKWMSSSVFDREGSERLDIGQPSW
jgi:hypothetical protein